MEKQQLASYWIAEKVGIIIENILKGYYSNQESFDKDWINVFNQAGEMERQQIIDAWLYGQDDGATICTPNQQEPAEQYYNETYGN